MLQRTAVTLLLLIILAPGSTHASWVVDGTPVCTQSGSQIDPYVIPDGSGGVYISWSDDRAGGGDTDIYIQHFDINGNALWTANGIQVVNDNADQIGSSLALGPAGGVIVMWSDERSGGNNWDIYCQLFDVNGSPQWTISGVPICTAQFSQTGRAIAADGEGGAIMAWTDRRAGTDNDVYAQRVNFLGTPVWAANGVVVASTPETQQEVQMIPSGTGHAIAAWRDHRDADGEVFAQRLGPAGAGLWTANGHQVSTGAAILGSMKFGITDDGSNGLIATWHDARASGAGVYAQRILIDGSMWANDVPLTLEAYSSTTAPAPVPDGAGGAIVAFLDYRNANFDIYAQRIDSNGVNQWGPSGYAVVDTIGTQAFFDAAGNQDGIVVVWRDQRSADDLYAQKLDLSGAPQWPSQGVPICTANGAQSMVAVAEGLYGGAIAAWSDPRGVDSDIYAYGINLVVTGVPETPPTRTRLNVLGHSPNPFNDQTSFRFSLSEPAEVTVDVFDVAGRRVWRTEQNFGQGAQGVAFAGRRSNGERLPTGVYFYRVSALGETQSRKMVIIR